MKGVFFLAARGPAAGPAPVALRAAADDLSGHVEIIPTSHASIPGGPTARNVALLRGNPRHPPQPDGLCRPVGCLAIAAFGFEEDTGNVSLAASPKAWGAAVGLEDSAYPTALRLRQRPWTYLFPETASTFLPLLECLDRIVHELLGHSRLMAAQGLELPALRLVVRDEEVLDLVQPAQAQFAQRAHLRPVVRRLNGADETGIAYRFALVRLLGLEDAERDAPAPHSRRRSAPPSVPGRPSGSRRRPASPG